MVDTHDFSTLGTDEQFALMTEAIPALQIDTVGVLFFDMHGRITNANRTFQRMTGYSLDELRSIPWSKLTGPEFMDATRRASERLANEGVTPPYEKQMIRKDGSRWWGLFAPTRINGTGHDSQCVEFVVDITAAKHHDQELRAQARLLDLSSDAIISRDLDGKIIFWNRGAEVIYGWLRHEAMGKNIHELLKTQWPEPRDKVVRKLMQHGSWSGELIHTTRAGEQKRLFCRKVLDRERGLVMETNTDITELQVTRSQLAQREALLRSLAREARVGLVVVSKDRRYLFANQRYADIVGVEMPVEGKRVEDVIGPLYEDIRSNLDRAFAGEHVTYEVRIPHHRTYGTERFCEIVCEPRLENPDNPYIVVVVTDITERKLAQQNLERTVAERTAELRQANEHLEAFVYSIAHDLRAPLRAMQGYSHLLLSADDTNATEDEKKTFVRKINQSAEFMDKLVLDLLAFGRTASTEMSFNGVDLEAVWHAAVYQCTPEIERTNALLEVKRPLCRVRAHEPTLTQVIANLLSNALKFVEPGTRPHIEFGCNGEGRCACIWIQDNGVGIEPQYHDRIFRVFERLNGSRFAGTGIGLAIVRKGVERMNGSVGLESAPGKGTRFWIELPRA